MDGISVAASVVGLIQAASATAYFISSFQDAPSLASAVHREASALAAICVQMQEFLCHKLDEIDQERGNMIFVEQVITTVAGLMCAFSELKSLLGSLLEEGKEGWEDVVVVTTEHTGIRGRGRRVWDRAKWASKEQGVQKVLDNLRMHKESLTLMLTISTCNSNIEARAQMRDLKNNIVELLKSNASLVTTINKLKSRPATSDTDIHSISQKDFRASISGRSSPLSLNSDHSTTSQRSKGGFPFSVIESILHKSRPYTRLARRNSMSTLKTVVTATSHWSELEGLSVSKVSSISMFRIPFRPGELQNSECYDFSSEINSHSETDFDLHGLVSTQSFPGPASVDGPLQGEERGEARLRTKQRSPCLPPQRNSTWYINLEEEEEYKRKKKELSKSTRGSKKRSLRISAPVKSTNSLAWAIYNPENSVPQLERKKQFSSGQYHEISHQKQNTGHARSFSNPPRRAMPTWPDENIEAGTTTSQKTSLGIEYGVKVYGSAEYAYYYCAGCGRALEENKEFKLAGDTWHIGCLRRKELLRLEGLSNDKSPIEDEEVGEDVLAALESLLPPLESGHQSTSTSSFSSRSTEYPLGSITPATSISTQSSPHNSAHPDEPKNKPRPESQVLDQFFIPYAIPAVDKPIAGNWKPCERHEHECHGCGWFLDKQLLSINYLGCHWHVECFSKSHTDTHLSAPDKPKITEQEGRILQEIAGRLSLPLSTTSENVPSLCNLRACHGNMM